MHERLQTAHAALVKKNEGIIKGLRSQISECDTEREALLKTVQRELKDVQSSRTKGEEKQAKTLAAADKAYLEAKAKTEQRKEEWLEMIRARTENDSEIDSEDVIEDDSEGSSA